MSEITLYLFRFARQSEIFGIIDIVAECFIFKAKRKFFQHKEYCDFVWNIVTKASAFGTIEVSHF